MPLIRSDIVPPGRLSVFGLSLLAIHVVGMVLVGFSRQQLPVLTELATIAGVVAIPLCAWSLSRWIDRAIKQLSVAELLKVLLRIVVAVLAIALLPVYFRILKTLPLPVIGRVLEVATATLSIAVLSGMVLLGFGVADLLYLLTKGIRKISTRLMLLVLVAALGTFFWLTFLGLQSRALLGWAIEQGHLVTIFHEIPWMERLSRAWVGTLAGAISLELPFIIIMAWRFGRKATSDIRALNHGFARVSAGILDKPVQVDGSDEIAEMQKGFNKMLNAVRERRFLETAFGRYVSPHILEKLRREPDLSQWEGEKVQATILFSDIRGFTELSAKLAPESVIRLLNRYFAIMIDVVSRYEGYINKFVGDAIMVIWNTPVDDSDHAERAIICAAAMQEALVQANEQDSFDGIRLEMGIGISTGYVIAGNLGNQQVAEFTVIGDAVNVANRACAVAKGGEIVLTRQSFEAATAGHGDSRMQRQIRCDDLGEVELKGKGFTPLLRLDRTDLDHLI